MGGEMRRHELTERQWQRLQPLLPPEKPAVGRPNHGHRRIINGIRGRLRTGAPWRDLPERYGPWETVYSRFRRWQRKGVWQRILETVQAEEDAAAHIDWDLHFVDGSVVRAHSCAAGAKRGRIKRSDAVAGASRRKSTSAPRGKANPSSSR
jgi:transposase